MDTLPRHPWYLSRTARPRAAPPDTHTAPPVATGIPGQILLALVLLLSMPLAHALAVNVGYECHLVFDPTQDTDYEAAKACRADWGTCRGTTVKSNLTHCTVAPKRYFLQYEWVHCEGDGCGIQDSRDQFRVHYYHAEYPDTCPEGERLVLNTAGQYACGTLAAEKNLGSCDGSSGKGLGTAGNPVNVGTGNKFQRQTDLAPVTGNGVALQRMYNSAASQQGWGALGRFGRNWQSTYERHVDYPADDVATKAVHRPDGRLLYFIRDGADWRPDDDVHDTLEAITDAQAITIGWRYTSQDTEEFFDLTGKLRSITSPDGRTQLLEYALDGASGGDDNPDTLDRVSDSLGHSLWFGYDLEQRIATVTHQPSGRSWGYRYDAAANLEYVDHPDGTTRRYHYEDPDFPHALTGITDERGIRYATYAYDSEGRAIASHHAGNAGRVDIGYDDAGGTRTVTNSRGTASTYLTTNQLGVALVTDISGPGCATCGTGNTGYQFDPANNNLLARTENGLITKYGNYDGKGNYRCKVEGATLADPTAIDSGLCDFDPVASPNARRTDYTYDPRFQSRTATRAEPSVFPGASTITTYTYDDYGNRTAVIIDGFQPDGTPLSRSTRLAYNGPLHQLSRVDGPRTDVDDYTFYDYYPDDPAAGHNRARLKTVTDANGVKLRDNISYTATGKIQSEVRPNGLALSYQYYPGSDRLEILQQIGGGRIRATRFAYLPTGELETITQGWGTPAATRLSFAYDDARRLTRITDGLGHYTEYVLDTEGNRVEENTHDAGGALKRQVQQSFDDYNRLSGSSLANQISTPEYAPDGTLDTKTDGRGSLTDYRYDDLRRLTRLVENLSGADPATRDITTGYGYDAADRLTTVTDPNGNTTTYVYDDLGNQLSIDSPDTGLITFQYDAAGNLVQKTDAKGQSFSYQYDTLNRLTRTTSTDPADDVAYTYDSCAGGQDKLCRVSNPAATVHYAYNAFGELTTHQGVSRNYDHAGRLQALTYPSGAVATYHYDDAGQADRMELTHQGVTQTLAGNIQYQPFGPITELTFGNNLQLTQAYDGAYRMTSQAIAGIGLVHSYTNYDGNGNLQVRNLSSQEDFSYDPLNRLDTALATYNYGNQDFDYDPNGNRTSFNGESYTYQPASNRLDAVGNTSVLLDANGNTLNKGNWTYGYTTYNRLKTASENNNLKGTYHYNGLGQRTRKSAAGNQRRFIYGENGELLAETDAHGTVLVEYIFLNGQLLARFEPDNDGDGQTNLTQHQNQTNPQYPDQDEDGLTDAEELYTHGTDPRRADTDGDGFTDGDEISQGADPLSAADTPPGDINADGQINTGDYLLLMRILLNLHDPDPDQDQVDAADLNRDGQVDAGDAIILLRKVTGQVSTWLSELPQSMAVWLENQVLSPAHADPIPTGRVLYYHLDQLGTPVKMTDEAGLVVWAGEYQPFGDADVTVAGAENFVRFPGQYFDEETSLHYNYFRDYEPSTGRYLQSDPIGIEGGLNTYVYVEGNPLKYFDPTGEFAFLGVPAWVWVTGGATVATGYGASKAWQTSGGPASVWGAFSNSNESCESPSKPAIPDVQPKNICEQLALAAAKAGAGTPKMKNLADEPRLVAHYGPGPWVKMEYVHHCPDGRKLVIHYFRSLSAWKSVELKFVGYGGGVHPGLPGITN